MASVRIVRPMPVLLQKLHQLTYKIVYRLAIRLHQSTETKKRKNQEQLDLTKSNLSWTRIVYLTYN